MMKPRLFYAENLIKALTLTLISTFIEFILIIIMPIAQNFALIMMILVYLGMVFMFIGALWVAISGSKYFYKLMMLIEKVRDS